jgi:hypothetical protein
MAVGEPSSISSLKGSGERLKESSGRTLLHSAQKFILDNVVLSSDVRLVNVDKSDFNKILEGYDLLSNLLDRHLMVPKQRYPLGEMMVKIAQLANEDVSTITKSISDYKSAVRYQHPDMDIDGVALNEMASQMVLLDYLIKALSNTLIPFSKDTQEYDTLSTLEKLKLSIPTSMRSRSESSVRPRTPSQGGGRRGRKSSHKTRKSRKGRKSSRKIRKSKKSRKGRRAKY